MTYTITLTTNDDKQINFPCMPEQTVQDAAEASGFFLPALCKEGSCGSCLGRCVQGDYRLGKHSPSLLPENHQQNGDVLLCCTYAHSDLQLTAPYKASQIQTHLAVLRDADIVSMENIADRTVRLVLQLLPDEQGSLAFEFESGQFVELEVPGLSLKRAYSIANAPNWDGRLEFLIRLQANGQFSGYLRNTAQTGQRLKVSAASGSFGIQNQSLAPRCFVAGGTGLAPFLSILRRMAEWGEDHPTALFFGVNNEQEIFFADELTALKNVMPQLHIEICVWQPSATWTGFTGTPTEALRDYLRTVSLDTLPDVFLCGPPLLVESAAQVALEAGVSEERIVSERFA